MSASPNRVPPYKAPKESAERPCPKCGETCRPFYASAEGACYRCYCEAEGITPNQELAEVIPGGGSTGRSVPVPIILRQWDGTDVSNAQILEYFMGGGLKYAMDSGEWYFWDGRTWKLTPEKQIDSKVSGLYKVVTRHVTDPEDKRPRGLKTGARIRKMVDLSRTLPGIACKAEDFDRDPWLFTVSNGTLDLRTGELLRHDPEHMITKAADVECLPDAGCSRFEEFIDTILGHDAGLISFVQRALGYALLGDNPEQVFFMLHGSGANGKTVLMETVSGLFGEYAGALPADSLKPHRPGSPRNDLDGIRGARWCTAVELNPNDELDEALLKQFTGGDRLNVRALYKEFLASVINPTLVIGTNHEPRIRGTDTGIWRRFVPVPLGVTIPEDKRVLRLQDKLLEERSGILNWMLDGLRNYLELKTLAYPDAVLEMREVLRVKMDPVWGFQSERCATEPGARVPRKRLYEEFSAWCQDRELDHMSSIAFNARIKCAPGVTDRKSNGDWYWMGMKLNNEE